MKNHTVQHGESIRALAFITAAMIIGLMVSVLIK
jgi:hypothetical protein